MTKLSIIFALSLTLIGCAADSQSSGPAATPSSSGSVQEEIFGDDREFKIEGSYFTETINQKSPTEVLTTLIIGNSNNFTVNTNIKKLVIKGNNNRISLGNNVSVETCIITGSNNRGARGQNTSMSCTINSGSGNNL